MLVRQRTATRVTAVVTGLLLGMAPVAQAVPAASASASDQVAIQARCGFHNGHRLARQGSRGPHVKEVQCIINRWAGWQALRGDGAFGIRTHSWVVYFQERKGLKVDGVVGPQTWRALRAV